MDSANMSKSKIKNEYTYKILRSGDLSVYRDGLITCMITNSLAVTLDGKIKYFERVFG